MLGKFIQRVLTLAEVRREIRRIDPDFVLCQSEYEAAFLWAVCAFTRYRYVVKVFGQMFLTPEEPAKYFFPFAKHFLEIRNSLQSYRDTIGLTPPRLSQAERALVQVACLFRYLAVRKAALVLTLSPQSSWEVKKLYGCPSVVLRSGFPSLLLTHVPPGNLRSKLGLEEDAQIVTCFSRLVSKKRIDLAVRAFALISQELSRAHMLICGKGPEANNLKELVRALSLESRVTFTGYLAEAEVADYLVESTVIVNLDVAQFDIVALEAIAAGKRVVGLAENEFDKVLKEAGYILGALPEPINIAEKLHSALIKPLPERTPEVMAALQGLTWDAYARNLAVHLANIR